MASRVHDEDLALRPGSRLILNPEAPVDIPKLKALAADMNASVVLDPSIPLDEAHVCHHRPLPARRRIEPPVL